LSNTSLHTEPFTSVNIGSDCAFAVLVEILQNRYYLLWKAVHPEDFPKSWPVYTVKGSAEVIAVEKGYEGYGLGLFPRFVAFWVSDHCMIFQV